MSDFLVPQLEIVKQSSGLPCPECTRGMRGLKCADQIVFACREWHGIWFPKGALSVFKEQVKHFDLTKVTIDSPEKADPSAIRGCPHCQESLESKPYGYQSKITLLRCSKCEGNWIAAADFSELLKLSRLGQELRPHLQAIATELKEVQKEKEAWAEVGRIGQAAGTRGWVGYYPPVFIVVPLSAESGTRPTWGTFLLAIINIIVFAATAAASGEAFHNVLRTYAMIPSEVMRGHGLLSLVTSSFLHADFLHLLGNMLFLFVFGRAVESGAGTWKFLQIYFLTLVAADVGHLVTHLHSDIPTVGASGAISGVMGAFMGLYPTKKIKTYVLGAIVDIPSWLYLGGWFLSQVWQASLGSYIGESGIAWMAHLVGFMAGFLLGRRSRPAEAV